MPAAQRRGPRAAMEADAGASPSDPNVTTLRHKLTDYGTLKSSLKDIKDPLSWNDLHTHDDFIKGLTRFSSLMRKRFIHVLLHRSKQIPVSNPLEEMSLHILSHRRQQTSHIRDHLIAF